MLTKTSGPAGAFWLRKRFDARDYTAPAHQLAVIATWRDQATFDELLALQGGPFLNTFQLFDRFDRDGKRWARFRQPTMEYCFDVEIRANGDMGEIVPVAAEEAWRLALATDQKHPGKIVMED